MSRWLEVCALSTLGDPGACEFSSGDGDWPLPGFVVHYRQRLSAYENRCPHAGHRLNWRPERFFDREGRWLLCASHGAVFDPENGHCVAGPCPGARLRALPVRCIDGRVEVDVEGWTWGQ